VKLFRYAFLVLFLLCSGCGLLSDDSEPEPGSRNYIWVTEDVNGPFGFIYDFWGTAHNSLWVAASSDLWYYNGEEWTEVEENQDFHCGTFESIFGFTKDDIWVGCNDGRIHHFDGTSWKPSFRYDKEEFYLSSVDGIWGTSSDDMYATGYFVYKDTSGIYSFLLHYDGRRWQEVLITDFEAQFQRVRKDHNVYLYGLKEGPEQGGATDSLAVYSLGFKGFIQEFIEPRSSTLRMNSVDDKIYYVIENTLYRLDYPGLTEVISFPESTEVYDILGRHKNDLIFPTNDGLMHYNGKDLEYIYDIELELFSGYRTFVVEDEIFVLIENIDQNVSRWELQRGILNATE